MRKIALAATAAAALAVPATAEASYSHIVEPGESLTSIASADGMSLSALAAANGLSTSSELQVGQVVEIPPLTTYTSRSAARTYTAVSSGSYTVRRGDTLSRIAMRAGTSVAHLAAINRLNPNHLLIAGTTLRLSGSATAAAVTAGSSTQETSSGGTYVVRRGDTLSAIAIRQGTTIAHLASLNGLNPNHLLIAGTTLKLASSASGSVGSSTYVTTADTSSAGGTYVVQPGDSLGTIATRAGTSVSELAALNGIDPDHLLLIGTVLSLPSGSGSAAATSGPATGAGNQQIAGATNSGPYPTAETVSSSEIGGAAEADGLDPSLAEAIGWQESGYNNDLVSSTGAVGVMQIEPATWSWINQVLTPGAPLSPSSAYDNVRGGVMLLHNLVAQTGSDALAAAAYYQGLASVREHGLYSDTEQYVKDVTALQGRF